MFAKVLFAVAGVAATAVLWAPQAAAQPDLTSKGWDYTDQHGPVICAAVDIDPTVVGFANTLERVALDGFSVYESSGIMIAALSTYCPRNYWLVDAFINTSSPPPVAHTIV